MKYYLPEHGETAADAVELPSTQTDPRQAAQLAAHWCHNGRNGREWEWPKLFALIDKEGKEHRFLVDRKMVPEFYASAQCLSASVANPAELPSKTPQDPPRPPPPVATNHEPRTTDTPL